MDKYEQHRTEKLNAIKDMGIDPYGQKYEDAVPAECVKAQFKEDDDN